MMSTLNSSLLSFNHNQVANSTPPAQPPTGVAPNKHFAHIMAKAKAPAPQAAPSVPAKPAHPENPLQAGSNGEDSRAEANARSNAKAAARAVAARALVKAPGSEVHPQTEPHIEPHVAASDHVPCEANQTDNRTAADGAALSADMAAWVAALNPTAVNSSAAQAPPASGEVAVTESELSAQLVTQAAGQTAADKNTQILREDAKGDASHGRAHGTAGQRTATDGSGPSGQSGQSGQDGQQSQSRGSRAADEMFAASRAPTSLPSALQNTAPEANAMAMLSKEVTSAAATASTANTDFSALMASSMNATNGTSTAQDTLTLSLPTPVNSPEFREALGVQISLLARDGVQTAELHLNPSEMGPVSIQIVMEGNQARVDFGADVAATRAAIEAGMPELASALLDAGFTLAGGGVSQHAKGQDQAQAEGRQGSTRRNIPPTASSLVNPAAQAGGRRVQLTAGGVDLFV